MRSPNIRSGLLLAIVISTAAYGLSGITIAHAAGPLTGSFTSYPQFMLIGGNDSFTGSASGGLPPYTFSWNFGDGSPIANGGNVTHIYKQAGSYTVKMNVTDSTTLVFQANPQTLVVQGSPLNIDGWFVNWNLTAHHGIEIYNITYNGVLTIRDALINGVLVKYYQQPPGQSCIFFDDLGPDDIHSSIGGLRIEFSSGLPDPWFQIRAQYNPSVVGYNYTQFWRFYQGGRWDALMYVGHIGCGWNHTYQPHYRISLATGNKNRDLMSQYTPSGSWQNLVWEGNYTDNGFRDLSLNSTQWRFGDGRSYYYLVPKVIPFATDMPTISPKIYLVRDRAGELEPDIDPPSISLDPIIFANGELAYRQSIAFWYLPTFWDHWLYCAGCPQIGQPSIVSMSFYPSGI